MSTIPAQYDPGVCFLRKFILGREALPEGYILRETSRGCSAAPPKRALAALADGSNLPMAPPPLPRLISWQDTSDGLLVGDWVCTKDDGFVASAIVASEGQEVAAQLSEPSRNPHAIWHAIWHAIHAASSRDVSERLRVLTAALLAAATAAQPATHGVTTQAISTST